MMRLKYDRKSMKYGSSFRTNGIKLSCEVVDKTCSDVVVQSGPNWISLPAETRMHF